MTNSQSNSRASRSAVAVSTALTAMFMLCGSASAEFLINCAGCHTVPQNGMAITNYQSTANLGAGLRKVFQVSPGQTAVIQWNVTNGYSSDYALNINNLGAGGVNNTNDHMACTADPAWINYFAGTSTNFFMSGCSTTSPHLWSFNLVVKTNTPADFYAIQTQMAGYKSGSAMWYQQETFYVQVMAAAPPVPALLHPQCSGSSFSAQVATTNGFNYYLEYKSDLATNKWNAAAQTPGDGTIKTLTNTTANDPQRFYRARVQ